MVFLPKDILTLGFFDWLGVFENDCLSLVTLVDKLL